MFSIFIFSFNAYAQDATGTEMAEGAASAEKMTAPAVAGSVARSAFSTDIVDREPVDNISSLDTNTDKVYYFTELKDFQGQTVTHRWEYNGQNMAEVKFNVGGARWRVHSSKNLVPEWVGTWKVSVVGANGEVVNTDTLQYTAAAEPAATKPMAAEPAADSSMSDDTASDDKMME